MQFIRAPDENVYVAPFNLIEIGLVVLFEWWMPRQQFELVNDAAMALVYSPLLLVTAFTEVQTAREIHSNRARGDDDDSVIEEWEQLTSHLDFAADGWDKKCESARSNVEVDEGVLETRSLRAKVESMDVEIQAIKELLGRMAYKLGVPDAPLDSHPSESSPEQGPR